MHHKWASQRHNIFELTKKEVNEGKRKEHEDCQTGWKKSEKHQQKEDHKLNIFKPREVKKKKTKDAKKVKLGDGLGGGGGGDVRVRRAIHLPSPSSWCCTI